MKHAPFEQHPNGHSDHQPHDSTHELYSGASYTVHPSLPEPDTTPIIASVYLGDLPTKPRHGDLHIADLRGAAKQRDGSIVYEGHSLDPAAQYALIQPSTHDTQADRGLRILYPGETFTLGRKVDESLEHFDMTNRASREHAIVRVALDGSALQIADLGSTNGTFVVDRTHEVPAAPERRQSIAHNLATALRPLGETAEAMSEEERLIHANLAIMLGNFQGSMRNLLADESVGGNAASENIDGVNYHRAGLNGLADQNGQIHLFTNRPHYRLAPEVTKKLPPAAELVRFTLVIALEKITVQGGRIIKQRPDDWVRSDQITQVWIQDVINPITPTEAVDKGVISPNAAHMLTESIKYYNVAPDTDS